jgi:aryl-alcohol dehydrogenase-like predicted oxidoreductase
MTPSLPGYATPDGTRQHATRMASLVDDTHYRLDPHSQLTLSSLGMGTYLGDRNSGTNRQVTDAALTSLRSGAINVLDTAINYRDQLAERALGEAVAEAVSSQLTTRDGLFISTKQGYLAPDANDPRPVPQYFKDTLIDTGILPPTEVVNGCHSLHPPFLQHQLDRSLSNLGLNTIDLLYLHNVAEAQLPHVKPTRLMARLEAAFDTLETARQHGKLQAYGLATWDCFRVPPGDEGYLSLRDVVKLAASVGGSGHGFRFIQLPFNLAMPEASMEAFQPDATGNQRLYPILRAAEALGIGVFTSVPLYQGQLLGVDGLPTFPGLGTPAQHCLQAVRCTPGIIAPLIGHKQTSHVKQNCQVAETPIMRVAGHACHA